jgi:tryptophan synthase alpha chain
MSQPSTNRIDVAFAKLQAEGRKALIPFIHCGDPFKDLTPELMWGMADAGADVIELGVPFSDPMADGPVIQRAAERALAPMWRVFAPAMPPRRWC